jgi:predicted secreted protein
LDLVMEVAVLFSVFMVWGVILFAFLVLGIRFSDHLSGEDI